MLKYGESVHTRVVHCPHVFWLAMPRKHSLEHMLTSTASSDSDKQYIYSAIQSVLRQVTNKQQTME